MVDIIDTIGTLKHPKKIPVSLRVCESLSLSLSIYPSI